MNIKIALLIGAVSIGAAGVAEAAVVANTCAPAKPVVHHVVHRKVLADAPSRVIERDAPPRVERVQYRYGYAPPPPPPVYDDYYEGGYYPAYGYGYGYGYPLYGYGYGYGHGFYGHGGYGFRGGYGGFHGGGFHGGGFHGGHR